LLHVVELHDAHDVALQLEPAPAMAPPELCAEKTEIMRRAFSPLHSGHARGESASLARRSLSNS
jgi:hypothetical protein